MITQVGYRCAVCLDMGLFNDCRPRYNHRSLFSRAHKICMKRKKIIIIFDLTKKEFDEDHEVELTEDETRYLVNLVCQQDDNFQMVHNIIKKLGGYII